MRRFLARPFHHKLALLGPLLLLIFAAARVAPAAPAHEGAAAGPHHEAPAEVLLHIAREAGLAAFVPTQALKEYQAGDECSASKPVLAVAFLRLRGDGAHEVLSGGGTVLNRGPP